MAYDLVECSFGDVSEVTDYVANGSFATLKENVSYSDAPDYAVLVRLVDHNSSWQSAKVYVSEHAYRFLRKSSLVPGDVVVANVGANAGTTFRVPLLDRPATLGPNAVRVRPLPDSSRERSLSRDYLYYWLVSPEGQGALKRITSGSAQPKFNKTDMRGIRIRLPPFREQEKAASLLTRLDQRIDLLRQTNATLESIAQALFKSWFVDFDPVRAKAENREPDGMDAATAALFPAEFKESAQGLIPQGWRVGEIYEAAEVRYGAPFASKLFNTERNGLPLVRIRDLKDEAPGVWTPEEHPKGNQIRPGDIVVGMDGEFRAYLWGGEVAWMNQRICMFSPKNGHSAAFVRSAIAAPLAHVEATETATTVIHLGKADIDRFRIVVPMADVARAFGALCQPLYDRIVAGKQAMRSLGSVRDSLLPRLISGKLRMPEAQSQLEEAIA